MSSINSNGSSSSLPYIPQSAPTGPSQGPQGTAAAGPSAGVGATGRGAISDEMAQAIGSGVLDVTKQKPPVPAEARPENYTQNARGAAEALGTFQAGASSPYHVALAANDAGAKFTKGDAEQAAKDEKQAQSRQRQISSQAKSILDSTSESEKGKCKTHYTNHDDNVKAMQQCGLSKDQAKKLTHLLEDGRTDQSVKDKIAYQLAAIGMTGSGASKAIAGNADEVKKGLEGLKIGGLGGQPLVNSGDLDKMKAADTSHAPTAASNTRTGGSLGAYSTQDLLNPQFVDPTTPSASSSSTKATGVSAMASAQSAISGSALSGAYGEMKNL